MTIEVIGKKMAKQNNRMTQYVMFAIQVDVEVPAPEELASDYKRKDSDDWDPAYMCEDCLSLVEKEEDLSDSCEECDSNQFWHFNVEQKLKVESTGVFFTAEACQAHINANKYHYRNPKVYGIGSWRNPEMQFVQKHILNAASVTIPSHYE